MRNYEWIITQIKSDLIGLWNERTSGYSYSQWFDAVAEIIGKHLGIKRIEFFIYDRNKGVYIQLKDDGSLSNELIEAYEGVVGDKERLISSEILSFFQEKGFEWADEIVIFSTESNKDHAFLLVETTAMWKELSATPYFEEFKEVMSDLIRMVEKIKFLETRENKFRQLFNLAELFNSTMSSQVILEGIMNSIAESFPSFKANLLLSHDHKELTHDYTLFDYTNESPATIEAFVSGEVTIEDTEESEVKIMNAPIKGKQGIYGVLQIEAPPEFIFSVTQSNFVKMLANTAGSSLENASLYDQSHRLIEDLQLVNETSRRLNSNIEFDEMIRYLKKQLFKAIEPVEIAFILYDEQKKCNVLEESTQFFSTPNGIEYIDFISKHIRSGKESLFDANFSTTVEGPVSFEAVIAIPITNQDERIGFIICLHPVPYFFSFESFKFVQLLIGHSSLAIANSMLRDQLQLLVDKDHLTKLYARRYLDNVMEEVIEKNEGGTLILMDIDDFKSINDTCGHSVGDQVLKQLSTNVLSKVKGKGVAARWGGEEFAIYLHCPLEEAKIFAEQLIKDVPTVTTPSVTLSAGMINWSAGRSVELRELFHYADAALYAAKAQGKNQVVIHDPTVTSHY